MAVTRMSRSSVQYLAKSNNASGDVLIPPPVVSATTGSPTIATTGGYTYYGFTGSGSITFSRSGFCDILHVGGGGGAGDGNGNVPSGGGGAGGIFLAENIFVSNQAYTVTVGAGGATGASNTAGSLGGDSFLVGLGPRGFGGGSSNFGYGGVEFAGAESRRGGSGGGATARYCLPGTSIGGQGNNGGTTLNDGAGGGGGAGAVGANGNADGGNGGAGVTTYSAWGIAVSVGELISSVRWFGGGGGGGSRASTPGTGGNGGGGDGSVNAGNATSGMANTGGGGGGAEEGTSGAGGSGVVIVRVPV